MLRLVTCIALACTAISAQSRTPPASRHDLDVISVRPVAPNAGPRGRSMGAGPGGQFAALDVTLPMLLNAAYAFPPERTVGAPRWADTQRGLLGSFDVVLVIDHVEMPAPN